MIVEVFQGATIRKNLRSQRGDPRPRSLEVRFGPHEIAFELHVDRVGFGSFDANLLTNLFEPALGQLDLCFDVTDKAAVGFEILQEAIAFESQGCKGPLDLFSRGVLIHPVRTLQALRFLRQARGEARHFLLLGLELGLSISEVAFEVATGAA